MKEASKRNLEIWFLGMKQAKILKELLNQCPDMDGRIVYEVNVSPMLNHQKVVIPIELEGDRPEDFEEKNIKDKWTTSIAEQYRIIPGFFDLNLEINFFFLDEIIRKWGSYDNYYR